MEVLQIPSELERMMRLHAKLSPRRVLEIGCWDGGTLRGWLQASPPPDLVVAVSLEHRRPRAYDGWLQDGTELVVGTGDSTSEPMVTLMQRHQPYDWAFIDGDHGYDYVKRDVDTVLPLIRKGGVLLLHDITPAEGEHSCGPLQVFDAIRDAGHRTEVYDVPERYRWTAGIGVVYV